MIRRIYVVTGKYFGFHLSVFFFAILSIGCSQSCVPTNNHVQPIYYGDHFPAPRPNSNIVAFSRIPRMDAPSTTPIGLYVVDTTTNQERQLVGEPVGRPSWLDENRILFSLGAYGQGKLMIYNYESDNVVTINGEIAKDPVAQYFGNYVVYEVGSRISIYNIQSSQVSIISSVGFFNPSWNPTNNSLIASMNTDSGSARILVEMALNGTIIREYTESQYHHRHAYPSWNRAGNAIVFESINPDEEGNNTHTIMTIHPSNMAIYTIHSGQYPKYSYDDRFVYFSDYPKNYESGLRIYRFTVDRNSIEQITH